MSTDFPHDDGDTDGVRDPNVIPIRPIPDEPARKPPKEPSAAGPRPWERPVPRRDIVPRWMREPSGRVAAVRWLAGHLGHHAAFHAVRVPHYGVKIAVRAPLGAGMALRDGARWVFDRDEAGTHHLRVDAAARRDHKAYAAAARIRKDRVRTRLSAVTAGAFVTAVLLAIALLAYPPSAWLIPAAAVIGFGWYGRPRGKPFAEPAIVSAGSERLTPDIIVRALNSLGLAEINKSIREGRDIQFTAPVQRDGAGWRAELNLPYGVTVTHIVERREQLASGLRRPLGAVWPEPDLTGHAGHLILWCGDSDFAQVKAPSWKLARSGQCDLFQRVPFGTDPRGRLVTVPVMFHNWLIGAIPRQGKTSSARVLACAAALDPSCELWIHELKGSGDFDPLERVCHRFISGIDDPSVEYAAESLTRLRQEIVRRTERLKKLPRELCPDRKVTRQIANRRNLGLWPIVAIVDECQNLFENPLYGKQAGEDAEFCIKIGPAFGVVLILATQRPDAKSLPTGISGNASVRLCHKVMGQVENDMILGTSMYKNGVRATLFRPEIDAGIGLLAGTAPAPLVVHASYLDANATERVAARARVLREAAGTITGHAAGQDDAAPARDVLADVLVMFARDEAGLQWPELGGPLASRIPERWADATADSVSAECRALGVPSVDVKALRRALKGCRKADVERAVSR